MTATHILLTRFSAVAVVNTIAGLAVIYGLKSLAGVGDIAANALGYGAGLTLSFILNRSWTFRSRGPWVRQFLKYALVVPVAYLFNLLTVLTLIKWGSDPYLAHAIGVLPYGATVFMASRWIFALGSAGLAHD